MPTEGNGLVDAMLKTQRDQRMGIVCFAVGRKGVASFSEFEAALEAADNVYFGILEDVEKSFTINGDCSSERSPHTTVPHASNSIIRAGKI